MVNVWLWGFLVFELKVQKEQKQIWNESLMIRTFEVKYEFAETELRWQDFFFQGLYSQLIMWFESVQLHLPGESDSGSWLYPCHVTCITFQYASTCVHIDMKPEQKDQRFHNMTMTTQFTDMVHVITAAKKRGKNYENKRLVKLNLWCAKQCLFH